MSKLILSLIFFCSSPSVLAQSETTTEIPTEVKRENLAAGEINIFINPEQAHKGHYVAEVGFRISPSWVLSFSFGNGFLHGEQRGGMTATGFGSSYSYHYERSYELNHSALKATWSHWCRRLSCWNLSVGAVQFSGIAHGREIENNVKDDTFRGKVDGSGPVIGYGYAWRWQSGLNIRLGMDYIHSNSLSMPAMLSARGSRMDSDAGFFSGLSWDTGVGYWF